MFVFLSKLLPLFVYPLGLTCLLLVLALILNRHKRLRAALIVSGLVILYLASNRWVAYGLAQTLEWRYLPPEKLPLVKAIVVLGGGTESQQYPRPDVEVNAAGDRILYAAKLYREGVAPVLLLSGGSITWQDGDSGTPAEDMAVLLREMGIPESALWLQNRSQNTHEDAVYSAEMLKEAGITEIVLVTSAAHMPRSVALFEHEGIRVIPAPVDYTVTRQGWQNLTGGDWQAKLISFIPNSSSLGLTTNVMKEYIGILMYHLQGWL
ncbi:uncharacterized conserved protein [Longilinea arvoryzae]|uniref:Uncharacterized conserved protein n=1 Tax=Longilinea arvoryzae TaxID=360412 RepID=A0A0S7BKP1_9CHLR|nr:YdcF family protein [Longilinea arvoryzae]GAP14802.1 uncharacterized conserved protein [Longilinea arvoryzae]